ncbi:MAG: penicillin-binding protein 2 [Thiobacillaceae bacterium]|nr:penicillin-binding protein 2 [Thiobacillaceae bacterium]MDW8322657.1 penicillin-binding protein 2 [Burkholderiales bacterium]
MKSLRLAPRNANPLLRLDLQRWRMRLALALIFAGFALLALRAAHLQVWQNEFLNSQGDKRINRVIPIPAHRGMILDRRGEPLAISTPVESVWVNPREAQATPEQIAALADLLGEDATSLARVFAERERSFVYLKRQLPPDLARRCLDLNIKGVYAQPEFRRYYPAGDVVAQVVGLTNVEDRGIEGLEVLYDTWLAGEPGLRRVIRDRKGNAVEELELIRLPKPGNNLTLSINLQIQYLAYRELAAAVELHRARAGSVVVLDARTGEILALATVPSFNPNNRATYSPERARNRPATDAFEPGSTIKPFLMAAALDAGIITPDTRIDTGQGYYYVGDKRITDVHPKGVLSIAEALQVSSNVAAARVALELKSEDFWRLLAQSGFGTAPGAGLPGEVAGRLRPWRTWRPIEKATLGYGHGLSVSLLQLARAYTAFANDGVVPPLAILKQRERVVGQRVMSAKTARTVRAMLERVTEDGGTAPLARVMGYRVAGKTGTAHKLVAGAYAPDKYIASFVGLAPASDPRLVVAVMIDEPSGRQYYGGLVAAPVFSRVMGGALRLMAVPPDAPLGAASAPNGQAPVIGEDV